MLSTTIEGKLLIVLAESADVERLQEQIEAVRQTFTRLYKLELTAALSEADHMTQSRRLFREVMQYLNHRFSSEKVN